MDESKQSGKLALFMSKEEISYCEYTRTHINNPVNIIRASGDLFDMFLSSQTSPLQFLFPGIRSCCEVPPVDKLRPMDTADTAKT